MDIQALIQEALDAGFAKAAAVETGKLKFLPEVRDMCAANRCGQYGKNWGCPPGCGTLEECETRVKKFRMGILMESVGMLEDSFDLEGMTAAAEAHRARFDGLVRSWRQRWPELLPLGAGGCSRCKACTYPDAPCRFPETLYGSLEGYGLMVSSVCAQAGIPYINGANTVTYVACIFLE